MGGGGKGGGGTQTVYIPTPAKTQTNLQSYEDNVVDSESEATAAQKKTDAANAYYGDYFGGGLLDTMQDETSNRRKGFLNNGSK